MYHYYTYDGRTLCSAGALPYPEISALPETGEVLWVFHRPPLAGRDTFPVTDPAQLTEEEGVASLCTAPCPEDVPPVLLSAIRAGRVRAVNGSHPRLEELLAPVSRPEKVRVNLLALGDVGSTLLLGLRLMGADVLDSIGICDVNEKAAARWEFEINQIAFPWNYDALPPVDVVPMDKLMDCDVFVFVASKGIPPVGSGVKDVRMAQYENNKAIVSQYAKQAREAGFKGLFCVVSDPVDALARAAWQASNTDENGSFDGKGLRPEQVQGYGLGVMNARAAYYAKRQPELFGDFLTEGRAFGPHGQDLVIANSIANYDDERSRALTKLAVTANMEMRALGYKPYVAPALSSGAISILLTLRGEWHYGAVYFGGIYMGCRTRYTAVGLETEVLDMPAALFERIRQAEAGLAALK